MTERGRRSWRISALAAVVVAAHVALLQGAPRIGGGRDKAGAWAVRLVPVAAATAAAPAEANSAGPVSAVPTASDRAIGAGPDALDRSPTTRVPAVRRGGGGGGGGGGGEARAHRGDGSGRGHGIETRRPIDAQDIPSAAAERAKAKSASAPHGRVGTGSGEGAGPEASTPAAAETVAQATGPSPSAAAPQSGPASRSAASAGAPPIAFRVMPSARLHYKVVAQAKGFELHGTGELDWRHDGNSYEARLELASPPLPRRMQQSTGTIGTGGLEPVRFADRIRSEKAAHFQRDQGKISFSNNQPDVPLDPGAQDRLSVILQLGAMIAGDQRRFGAGTAIAVQTASVSDAEVWTFTVEGEERLQLPGGNVTGLKLVRNPRKDFDTKVELWLAPGMDYAPIRLRLTQPNGDWVDQQWSSTDRT